MWRRSLISYRLSSTAHRLSLIACRVSLIACRVSLVACRLPLAAYRHRLALTLIVYRLSFTVYRSLLLACRWYHLSLTLIVYRLSFIAYGPSLIGCRLSFVACLFCSRIAYRLNAYHRIAYRSPKQKKKLGLGTVDRDVYCSVPTRVVINSTTKVKEVLLLLIIFIQIINTHTLRTVL